MNHHEPNLRIMSAIALVLLLAIPVVTAAPPPSGGPRLGGGAAPDGTLIGIFLFDTDGRAAWLDELDTLRTSSFWVMVYNPSTRNDAGLIDLRLTWETSSIVTRTVEVDGAVQVQTETVWNVTDERTYQVGAPYRGVDYTEVEPPKKEGDRLTIEYVPAEGRPFRIGQITHHTSPLHEKLAPQEVQHQYLETATIFGLGLLAAAAGIAASAWLHKRAGRYTPDLGPTFWIAVPILTAIAAFWFWTSNREGLVLEGTWPLLVAVAFGACCVSLQFWRDEPDRDLLLSIRTSVNSNTPRFRAKTVYTPIGEDPHPLSTDPRHRRYVEDTWRAWFWRVIFRARTYLELPETHRWNYDHDGSGAFQRLYMLEGQKDVARTEDPHFEWFPNGLRRPWVKIHRRGILQVPVSPWAQKEKVVDVLAKLTTMEEQAKDHQEVVEKNARLTAELETGVDKRAHKRFDAFLLRLRAVGSGQSFEEVLRRHNDILASHRLKVQSMGHGGQYATADPDAAAAQAEPDAQAPAPAAPAPAGRPAP